MASQIGIAQNIRGSLWIIMDLRLTVHRYGLMRRLLQ